MNHDKTLLVAYNRRMESKKYGGPGLERDIKNHIVKCIQIYINKFI